MEKKYKYNYNGAISDAMKDCFDDGKWMFNLYHMK